MELATPGALEREERGWWTAGGMIWPVGGEWGWIAHAGDRRASGREADREEARAACHQAERELATLVYRGLGEGPCPRCLAFDHAPGECAVPSRITEAAE